MNGPAPPAEEPRPAPEPAPGPGPGAGRIVVGLLLVLGGAAWLADALGVSFPWGLALPGLLVVVGLALAALAARGRSSGILVAAGAVLTVLLAVGSGARVPLSGGVGERVERPTSVAELRDRYELAVGSLTVDLTGLGEGGAALRNRRIEARVGVGELVVVLPEGWRGTATAEAGIGEVRLLGRSQEGLGPELRAVEEGPVPPGSVPLLVHLEASVGMGQVEVRRG
ncbi:MAG TPA: hypothetical protein VNP94_12020 [Actinomycetota bacterium]|nr:hypothetical protein [Actinomycetota bacterium]